MLVVVGFLLVSFSMLAGWIAADWPFWRRVVALAQLSDRGEWPESFYQPVARIAGRPAAFFEIAAPGERSIAAPALDAAAKWAEANNSVALLVLHQGKVQLERYWQGFSGDQLFSGRAMSRSLLGFMYGFAVADGKLKLDDPAGRYIDAWRDDPRGQITLRQLLHNTSGIEGLAPSSPPAGASGLQKAWSTAKGFLGKDSRLALGSDFASAAESFDVQEKPGTHFALSNAGAQLLGIALERATGMDYERYVQQRLWAPLGAVPAEFYMDRNAGMPAVYCCTRATAHDWLRLGSLLITDGALTTDPGHAPAQIIPRGWVAEIARTTPVNPLYGLQMWSGRAKAGFREYVQGSGIGVRHGEDFAADDVIWMEGGGGRTIWAVPSQQLVIVRLGRTSKTWDGSVLPNTLLRGIIAQDSGRK